MTSATADSITCWPADATSTCWCSIPRSTPIPAGKRPNPLRALPWPNSPPAANPGRKKDLGLMAMSYGNVYVASVAMGAKDEHTLKAFLEAEAYDGPSLIIAYSHCIAHGINMTTAMTDQKPAVDSGQWLLYRYNPERALQGENPLHARLPDSDPQSEESFCTANPLQDADQEQARRCQAVVGAGTARCRIALPAL